MKYLLLLLMIFSCDKVEEEYLWDDKDPEYELAQELAISECINDSKIFKEFDKLADFSTSKFSVGDIFKISQDENAGVIIYVKVNAINATDVELIYSSLESEYRKILSFEEVDHESIVTFLKNASCNNSYEDVFKATGLTSSSAMAFEWDKATILEVDDDDDSDDKPEAYQYVKNSLTVSASMPLFFYYYNGTKTYNYVLQDGNEEKELKSKVTITNVTNKDECENGHEDQEPFCDFDDLDTSGFLNCTLVVDEDAYLLSDNHKTKMISISGDANCKLLESMGSI